MIAAHTLSGPRGDSSRRLGPFQPRTTKQTESRRTPVKSTVARAFLRAVSPLVATSIPVVAHALSVPRRDSSRRLGQLVTPVSATYRTLNPKRISERQAQISRHDRPSRCFHTHSSPCGPRPRRPKQPNKPNLAELPCKERLPGQRKPCPDSHAGPQVAPIGCRTGLRTDLPAVSPGAVRLAQLQ